MGGRAGGVGLPVSGNVLHNQTVVSNLHTPKDDALYLLRRGWKPRGVANYLDLNYNTVRGWASKHGLTKQGNSGVARLPKGDERDPASKSKRGVMQHTATSPVTVRRHGADYRGGAGSSPAASSKLPTHLVIPDTQCKPGVPLDHLLWAGRYIAERKPDVVVHLGDHWDMPSLSSYEKRGSRYFEGKRVKDDIEAGNQGMALLMEGMGSFRPKRLILLRGNHEDRITRAINEDPRAEGLFGFEDLHDTEYGWEVTPYLEPVVVDGVTYSHYFYNPNTGRSYSGSIETMLRNIGFSFTMGHQQGLRWGAPRADQRGHPDWLRGWLVLHALRGLPGPSGLL